MDWYFVWTGSIDWRGMVGIDGKTGDDYDLCLSWQDRKISGLRPSLSPKPIFLLRFQGYAPHFQGNLLLLLRLQGYAPGFRQCCSTNTTLIYIILPRLKITQN